MCHSERSEESLLTNSIFMRFFANAQNDMDNYPVNHLIPEYK